MDLGPCFAGDIPGRAGAPQTGTTIVAVSFDGGVVIGADGRVSTGTYISNRASNKIQQLTDNTFLLRSGSAADTQAIGDYGAHCPAVCGDLVEVQAAKHEQLGSYTLTPLASHP